MKKYSCFDNEFSTYITYGKKNAFVISSTQESDCSLDGGYTFENVTNAIGISVEAAKELRGELDKFISENTNLNTT